MASLGLSQVRQLLKVDSTGPGTQTFDISVDADRLVLFLSCTAVTGSLLVEVRTKPSPKDNVGDYSVAAFPLRTSPTTAYERLVTPILLGPTVIRVTYTGPTSFSLYGKAVNSLEAEDILEVSIGAKVNPHVINEVLTLASTEYTINLPDSTREFLLKTRAPATLRYGFSSGCTSSDFLTLHPGCSVRESGISPQGLPAIYVQSNKPGTLVEVLAWTDE